MKMNKYIETRLKEVNEDLEKINSVVGESYKNIRLRQSNSIQAAQHGSCGQQALLGYMYQNQMFKTMSNGITSEMISNFSNIR